MEFDIGEIIVDEELEIGEVEFDVIKEIPLLEDLEVTPSTIEQNFNHPNSYGYDNVKVKAISSDTLNITPTTESQQHIGLYGTVNVSAVDSSIDSNIQAENIKKGVEILGVEGLFYDIMNKYITNTLEKLRIDNIPTGNLRLLQPGGGASAAKLSFVKYLEFPNNTDELGVWQFGYLTELLRFDTGYTTKFNNVCLTGCIKLKELIIRTNDVVPSLYNRNAIALASNGKIYVPKNMIEDYKVATNWINFANYFKELYIADTIEEKEQMLIDSEIESGSMIVCDIDESYTIKE